MPKRIYVENLPFSASERELKGMFAAFGEVTEVHFGRGQATVIMESDQAAEKAIKALSRAQLGGNRLKMKIEAR